jgi:hypothetical protein
LPSLQVAVVEVEGSGMDDYFGGAEASQSPDPEVPPSITPPRETFQPRLIHHLLAPGALGAAVFAWLLLQTPRSHRDVIAQVSGWSAVVIGIFGALFFACADVVATLRARRARARKPQ